MTLTDREVRAFYTQIQDNILNVFPKVIETSNRLTVRVARRRTERRYCTTSSDTVRSGVWQD
jgi:hypothetical protein